MDGASHRPLISSLGRKASKLTIGILITVVAIAFSVLIYFAGVQRGKLYRAEDKEVREQDLSRTEYQKQKEERENRIMGVVGRYRDLVNSLRSSNLNGMLKAGVLGLHNSEEVEEVCSKSERTYIGTL